MRIFFLFICASIMLIVSCTPPVVFDKPYPSDEANLEAIPDHYRGVFICESDSAMVIVDDKTISLRKENFFLLPLKYVEEKEDCRIDGQQMYVSGRSECIPLEFINDSIVKGTVIEHDTIFSMGESSVARMYNGHVVISQEMKDGEWRVSLLSLEEGQDVLYRAITDKTKIKQVRKITDMEDITTDRDKKNRYKIKPTMKQFEELIQDEKIFIECEYLSRVKIEKPKFKVNRIQ